MKLFVITFLFFILTCSIVEGTTYENKGYEVPGQDQDPYEALVEQEEKDYQKSLYDMEREIGPTEENEESEEY